MSFDVRTTTTAGATGARSYSTRVFVRGSDMRQEVSDSAPAPFGPGRVLLVLDRGARMVLLDTLRREYSRYDPTAVFDRVAQLQTRAGMSMKYGQPTVSVERLGEGEVILGQPTERWAVTTKLGITMSFGEREMTSAAETRTEYWYGNLELPVTDAEAVSSSPFTGSPGGAPFLAAMRDAYRQLPKGRQPLRVVARTTAETQGHRSDGMTMTTEVTAIRRGPLPADAFQIPAGYREVPLAMPAIPSLPGQH